MAEIKTKFINDPEQVTPELLEGYVLAYPDQVKLAAENVVVRANPKSDSQMFVAYSRAKDYLCIFQRFVQ